MFLPDEVIKEIADRTDIEQLIRPESPWRNIRMREHIREHLKDSSLPT